MGMFDSITVSCPSCGKEQRTQSKSGPCRLDDYELDTAPINVLLDANRYAPFKCPCGALFKVKLTVGRETILVDEEVKP